MLSTQQPSAPPEESAKKEPSFARSVTVLSLACTVIALLLLGVMALKIYEPWGILAKPGAVDTTLQRLRQMEALQKLQEVRLALLGARIASLESKDTARVIRQLNVGIAGLDNLGRSSTSGQKIRVDKLRTDFKTAVKEIERETKNTPAELEKLDQGLEDIQDYYLQVILPEK